MTTVLVNAARGFLTRYRELVTRRAQGEQVSPSEILDAASRAGIEARTAQKHLDTLAARIQASAQLAEIEAEDADIGKQIAERDAEVRQARDNLAKVQAECDQRLEEAKGILNQAKFQLRQKEGERERQTSDAYRTLRASESSEIRRQIHEQTELVERLEEERRSTHPTFTTTELDALKSAKAKQSSEWTAYERKIHDRYGNYVIGHAHRIEARTIEQRLAQIPREIESAQKRIAELQGQLVDPVQGMDWS